ncbi:MAG: nuclear transport factor 2 family protein [Kiloniellaceae bacterium]
MTPEAAAERYIAFCESMTPDDLARLEEVCAPGIRFRDPFNEVTGVDAYRRVLARMFADVGQPEFRVSARALAGSTCFLRWSFTFRSAKGGKVTIEGVSEVAFGPDGRVTRHADFWDAGRIYERIPLLGGLVRLIRRRLSIG